MTRNPFFSADHAGGIAAGLCGFHCAVMPMIPIVSGFVRSTEQWGIACLVISLLTGAFAMARGWNRHRTTMPGGLWMVGSAVALVSHLAEGIVSENWLAVVLAVGAAGQMGAHWLNHRFSCGKHAGG